MPNFGGTAHFRTALTSNLRAEGYRGGYQFFLGRFETWTEFDRAVRSELESEGCLFLEYDVELEIGGRDELEAGEQQELFDGLVDYPLQFRTRNLYRNDDA